MIRVSSMTPSCRQLAQEGLPIQTALHSGGLRLGLINLMPDKATTERHWLRLLAMTGIDMHVDLLCLSDWQPKNTPAAYLRKHYLPWNRSEADVFVVTGAPLGLVADSQVGYWNEMERIFSSLSEQPKPALYLCWAANTALSFFYQLARVVRPEKLSGIYSHQICAVHPLLKNLPQSMQFPHSRYAEAEQNSLLRQSDLTLLINSPQAGACLISDDKHKRLFLLGHPEYEADTLHHEYERDIARGKPATPPVNYYPNAERTQRPQPVWQDYGQHLLTNWLRQLI